MHQHEAAGIPDQLGWGQLPWLRASPQPLALSPTPAAQQGDGLLGMRLCWRDKTQ